MWFYMSISNFIKVGQVLTEIWIFEISPIVKDRDFSIFDNFSWPWPLTDFDQNQKASSDAVCGPVEKKWRWYLKPCGLYRADRQTNKWKRSKRATLAKSIFFLTLTVDRFRPKFKSFVPSGICTCRKKMEMISKKWWPVSGYQIWQNRKLTYTVTSVIRDSDALHRKNYLYAYWTHHVHMIRKDFLYMLDQTRSV